MVRTQKWLGKQSKCSKLVKKSSELSQKVPKCPAETHRCPKGLVLLSFSSLFWSHDQTNISKHSVIVTMTGMTVCRHAYCTRTVQRIQQIYSGLLCYSGVYRCGEFASFIVNVIKEPTCLSRRRNQKGKKTFHGYWTDFKHWCHEDHLRFCHWKQYRL